MGREPLRAWWRRLGVRSRCTRAVRPGQQTPVNVPVPRACCAGWFFEHTEECAVPDEPRPCSDCAAEPGTAHSYDCQWWWD